MCFYMKMVSSGHSSSFVFLPTAGCLSRLYNLYLIIAVWSLEERFWHWKALLRNTWFSPGRGRLEWKNLACRMVADGVYSVLLDTIGLSSGFLKPLEQHFPQEARQLYCLSWLYIHIYTLSVAEVTTCFLWSWEVYKVRVKKASFSLPRYIAIGLCIGTVLGLPTARPYLSIMGLGAL